MRIHINIDIKVNRLVKYFIISDLVFWSGWGMMSPVFSVFIVQQIPGATLVTVGIAAATYWITRSVIQLPLASFLDRTDGEKDDFYALIVGLIIASLSAFAFVLVQTAGGVYIVEALHAAGLALYAVSWQSIFSRHLDKDRVSFDWALDSTAIGIATGVSGLVGGIVASWLGFSAVFVSVGVLSAVSALILIMVPDIVLPKAAAAKPVIQDHKTL